MQKPLLVLILLFCFQFSFAQQREVITTTASFLNIHPEARLNSMGEVSTVSSSEYPGMGLFGNPALLNQGERVLGLQFSYMPWRNMMYMNSNINAGAYYSLSDRLTVAYNFHQLTGINLFYMDDIDWYEIYTREESHNLRAGYAITENFSIGAGGKFFRSYHRHRENSNLPPHFSDMESFAFDAGFLYNNEMSLFNSEVNWQAGAHVENLGPKAGYGNLTRWPIPSRINMGLLLNFTGMSEIMPNLEFDLAYQTQRLLVPYDQHELTAFNSIITGLGDLFVPNQAFRFVHQLGAELRNNFASDFHLALRAGHYNQHYRSGNRKYLTYGLGVGFKMVHLDVFYANSLNSGRNKVGATAGLKFNLGDGG